MTDSNPILFFSPGACSLGAMVALEWSGKPYNLCRVEKPQRQSEAYLKLNKTGQVPALKTESRLITENSAILQHIAGLDTGKQIAFEQGTQQFDKMNTLLSLLSSNFHVAFYPYFAPQRYHDDEEIQAEIKEKAVSNIRTKYDLMNSQLAGHDYLFGGDKPTIADAYFYGMVRWGVKLFDIQNDFPNLARFMANMEKDPAVKFALATEKGEDAKTTGDFKGQVELEEVSPAAKAA